MNFQKFLAGLALLSSLAGPAAAQDAPQAVTVTLTSYAFTPGVIVLKANTPAHLHLVNESGKGHSFSAPEFFASSTLTPRDLAKLRNGAVELEAGQSADLTVTPLHPGSYALKCSHFMHTSMGMTGSITVQSPEDSSIRAAVHE